MAKIIRGEFGDAPQGRHAVACLNLGPAVGDVPGNLSLAEREVRAAARANPDLRWVVLPELFTSAYADLRMIAQYAEDAEWGPSARRLTALARELDLYLAYGFPERPQGSPLLYDSANLVGPEGVLLTYRKRHLVQTTAEPEVFAPGEGLPVVEAGGMLVTVAICWDLGFPEVVREAATLGAELILAPCGWRDPWGPQYALTLAARALDNGVYVASANQLGSYPGASFSAAGHAYGPDGLRLSRPQRGGRWSVGALDPLALPRWRRLYGNTVGYEETVVPLFEEPAV